MNTLGAVAGALLGTFLLFEFFGVRLSLFTAVLVNALVTEPLTTGATFALVLAGVPVYHLTGLGAVRPPAARPDRGQINERD